jgi:hypothetical protein
MDSKFPTFKERLKKLKVLITSTFQTMDKKEETPEPIFSKEDIAPFPKRHDNVDRVKIAKSLIPTYEERLAEYLKKYDGEMDEVDFIKNEIRFISINLNENNQFTYGVKWDLFVKKLSGYKDFIIDRFKKYEVPKSQKKEKGYATNDHRLYALEVLCSDFIKHLTKLNQNGMDVKEIGEIISYITNVNPVDAYKKTLTADKHKRIIDKEFKDKIDEYKVKINKLKG